MYCIGKFPDEDDCVAVFPEAWLKEKGKCFWPKKQSSVRKLSKRGEPLDPENSNVCNVVILGKFSTYKDAQANLEAATFTSDLETNPSLASSASISDGGPPIPPAEGQSLVVHPAVQPLEDNVQDVLLVQQEDKGTQTEPTAYCSSPDVLNKISGMEATLKEHTEMLDLILSNLVHKSSGTEDEAANSSPITDKFVFPSSTEPELVELNQDLFSPIEKSSLERFLTGTGGSTLNDAFQRTIQKILSDDLAVKFSLKGKRGKKSLQDFPNLLMALKECVRSFPSLSTLGLSGQLDDKSCDDAISKALKKSADRVFQRNKKAGDQAQRMEVN